MTEPGGAWSPKNLSGRAKVCFPPPNNFDQGSCQNGGQWSNICQIASKHPEMGKIFACSKLIKEILALSQIFSPYRGVATWMIARLSQLRNDFSAAPQLFKCKTTIKAWRGFLCRAIIEVATPRLDSTREVLPM